MAVSNAINQGVAISWVEISEKPKPYLRRPLNRWLI